MKRCRLGLVSRRETTHWVGGHGSRDAEIGWKGRYWRARAVEPGRGCRNFPPSPCLGHSDAES